MLRPQWQYRNKIVHALDSITSRTRIQQDLREEVRERFQSTNSDMLAYTDRQLFDTSLETLLDKPASHLHAWCASVDIAVKYSSSLSGALDNSQRRIFDATLPPPTPDTSNTNTALLTPVQRRIQRAQQALPDSISLLVQPTTNRRVQSIPPPSPPHIEPQLAHEHHDIVPQPIPTENAPTPLHPVHTPHTINPTPEINPITDSGSLSLQNQPSPTPFPQRRLIAPSPSDAPVPGQRQHLYTPPASSAMSSSTSHNRTGLPSSSTTSRLRRQNNPPRPSRSLSLTTRRSAQIQNSSSTHQHHLRGTLLHFWSSQRERSRLMQGSWRPP